MAGDEFPQHPPKPRLTLRVGITGKRSIPDTQREHVCIALAGVFKSLAQFLIDCHKNNSSFLSTQPPLLRIISGMAEGADQIAAGVAVKRFNEEKKDERERGTGDIETRLAAILPFEKCEFAKDFKQDPERPDGPERTEAEAKRFVDQFERLLNHPATESVLQIDDEALLSTGKREHRDQAYANLRDLLLRHSDVLVAISDDVYAGSGGTVDVIRVAVSNSLPVIKVSLAKPGIFIMRAAELDAPDQTPLEDEELQPGRDLPDGLRRLLNRMLVPPSQTLAPRAFGDAKEPSGAGQTSLGTFFNEEFKSAYFDRVFRATRDALSAEVEYEYEHRCSKAAAVFRRSWRGYRIDSPEQAAAKFRHPVEGCTGQAPDPFRILAVRYSWADALAVRYADGIRSSYVIVAFLGAIATLAGLVVLLLPEHIETQAKIIALVVEGLILAVAALFFVRPIHGRWRERMIEYRIAAELLRHQRFPYALGAADRLERGRDDSWEEADAWIGWYVRATIRELGFPTTVLSVSYRRKTLEQFQAQELDGQVGYNDTLTKRFGTIDRRLNKSILAAERFSLGIAVIGAIALTALYFVISAHGRYHESAELIVHTLKPFLTIILPAMAIVVAAIHRIRLEMEFQDTSERAAATGRRLSRVSRELKAALTAQPGRRQCLSLIRVTNNVMSDDLAGWSRIYGDRTSELS